MNARARNQQFNDVERQWVAGFANGDPEDYRLTMNNPPWVRQKMKEIAFHEAGHVAARAFTGHEWSHIVLVSIIPNATTLGRETSVRNLTEMWLPVMPPPIALLAGRELLLCLLAGRGAQMRVATDDTPQPILDEDSEEWCDERTDLYRAEKVATIMSCRHMPARRILELAEKWTVEMLDLPAVWDAVEKIAHELLERGSIENPEWFDPACERIFRMGMKLPRWKRRLCFDRAASASLVAPYKPHRSGRAAAATVRP